MSTFVHRQLAKADHYVRYQAGILGFELGILCDTQKRLAKDRVRRNMPAAAAILRKGVRKITTVVCGKAGDEKLHERRVLNAKKANLHQLERVATHSLRTPRKHSINPRFSAEDYAREDDATIERERINRALMNQKPLPDIAEAIHQQSGGQKPSSIHVHTWDPQPIHQNSLSTTPHISQPSRVSGPKQDRSARHARKARIRATPEPEPELSYMDKARRDHPPSNDWQEGEKKVQNMLTNILGVAHMQAPLLPSGHSGFENDRTFSQHSQDETQRLIFEAFDQWAAMRRQEEQEKFAVVQQKHIERQEKINTLLQAGERYDNRLAKLIAMGPSMRTTVDLFQDVVQSDDPAVLEEWIEIMLHQLLQPAYLIFEEMKSEIALEQSGAHQLGEAWLVKDLAELIEHLQHFFLDFPEDFKPAIQTVMDGIKAVCDPFLNAKPFKNPLDDEPALPPFPEAAPINLATFLASLPQQQATVLPSLPSPPPSHQQPRLWFVLQPEQQQQKQELLPEKKQVLLEQEKEQEKEADLPEKQEPKKQPETGFQIKGAASVLAKKEEAEPSKESSLAGKNFSSFGEVIAAAAAQSQAMSTTQVDSSSASSPATSALGASKASKGPSDFALKSAIIEMIGGIREDLERDVENLMSSRGTINKDERNRLTDILRDLTNLAGASGPRPVLEKADNNTIRYQIDQVVDIVDDLRRKSKEDKVLKELAEEAVKFWKK